MVAHAKSDVRRVQAAYSNGSMLRCMSTADDEGEVGDDFANCYRIDGV